MSTPGQTESEQLLELAEKGKWDSEKQTFEQRRKVIAFAMATRPDLSNIDLAKMFGISESMVRKDKDWVRTKASEEITRNDIGLVVVDILRAYEAFKERVSKSAKKATLGTNAFLAHEKMLMDYQLKVVEALQSLGYYPKNLGNLTKKQYIYKSHVNVKTGDVNTLPVQIKGDELPILDAQFDDVKALPPAPLSVSEIKDRQEDADIRSSLDNEFADEGDLAKFLESDTPAEE